VGLRRGGGKGRAGCLVRPWTTAGRPRAGSGAARRKPDRGLTEAREHHGTGKPAAKGADGRAGLARTDGGAPAPPGVRSNPGIGAFVRAPGVQGRENPLKWGFSPPTATVALNGPKSHDETPDLHPATRGQLYIGACPPVQRLHCSRPHLLPQESLTMRLSTYNRLTRRPVQRLHCKAIRPLAALVRSFRRTSWGLTHLKRTCVPSATPFRFAHLWCIL
jgi:hypothetical protein